MPDAAPPPSVDAVLTDAARYLQDVRTCDSFEADDPHHHPDGECRNCGWFKPDHLITDLSRLLGSQTWQPIETAPNHERVLLSDGHYVIAGEVWDGMTQDDEGRQLTRALWWTPLPPPPAPSGGPQ